MGGPAAPASKPAGGAADLLGDIFGAAPPMGTTSPTSMPAAKPAPFADLDGLGSLGSLGGGSFPSSPAKPPSFTGSPINPSKPVSTVSPSTMSAPGPTVAAASNYTIFEKDGLRIDVATSRNDAGDAVTLNATFRNTGSAQLSNLNFQAAVPKALKLQMMPASSSTVAPGGTATQVIRISNPSKVRNCIFRALVTMNADSFSFSRPPSSCVSRRRSVWAVSHPSL